ncbi:MAG: HDIG domain-containing metalloprotein [Patescibacteria group bacterium]|jgi:hypothetical protein
MNRQEALIFLEQNIQSKNLIKHSLAVEAVMKKLAQHFGEDEERWSLAGLLHDIDYETTKNDEEQHSIVGGKMLKDNGLDLEIVDAVIAHNEIHGTPRETLMAKSLFCSDPITGLIVASALVIPERKLASLTVDNILNRFKEKSFARGANRETISKCHEINLTLNEFTALSLDAMKQISNNLGL